MKKICFLCLIVFFTSLSLNAQRKDETSQNSQSESAKFVDLGLPSGTLWKSKNEDGGFYAYYEAVHKFGSNLPTKEQMEELKGSCKWIKIDNGFKVVGPNGNSITIPAVGFRDWNNQVYGVGNRSYYWSSSLKDSRTAWIFCIWDEVYMDCFQMKYGLPVRLIQGESQPTASVYTIPDGYVDLGLPSGILWKNKNEEGSRFYTYNQAIKEFGDKLPTMEQFEELRKFCKWKSTAKGWKVIGRNKNFIILPRNSYLNCKGELERWGNDTYYWSSDPADEKGVPCLYLAASYILLNQKCKNCYSCVVRLIYN